MIKLLLIITLLSPIAMARGDLKLKLKNKHWRYSYIKKALKVPQHFIVHKKDKDLFGLFTIRADRYSKLYKKGDILSTSCKIISKSVKSKCKVHKNFMEAEFNMGKKKSYQYSFIRKRSQKGFYWNRISFNKKPKADEIQSLISELQEQLK